MGDGPTRGGPKDGSPAGGGRAGGLTVAALRNLGPKSAAWLAECDIRTEADLRALGPVAAYSRVKHAFPDRVTLNLLYALHGALTDQHWAALPPELNAALRAEASK